MVYTSMSEIWNVEENLSTQKMLNNDVTLNLKDYLLIFQMIYLFLRLSIKMINNYRIPNICNYTNKSKFIQTQINKWYI